LIHCQDIPDHSPSRLFMSVETACGTAARPEVVSAE
jgi:hypothetical protein